MGIDISGFGRATRVVGRHSFARCEVEGHYNIGKCSRFLDGLKPGCYVSGTKSVYVYLSYASYDVWINSLSIAIHGISPSEVSSQPEQFESQPFFELITLPESNDVGIGPITSDNLHKDFVRYSAKAKDGFQTLAKAAAKSRRSGRKKRLKQPKPTRFTSIAAASIAKAVGGLLVGGSDDRASIKWEWKWQVYRDLRRAFKAACDDGFVLVSI